MYETRGTVLTPFQSLAGFQVQDFCHGLSGAVHDGTLLAG
jgi:hypothetical protein